LLKNRRVKTASGETRASSRRMFVVGASQNIWSERQDTPKTLHLAKKACRLLEIPYYVVDLAQEFQEIIIDDFVSTYLNGKTPNPCVICNQRIKFDLFFKRIEAAVRGDGWLEGGAEIYFATGHYARIESERDGLALKKGKDLEKDQSYMLYRLPRALLSRLVFPLGEYTRSEVLEEARRFDLPGAQIRSSQDACFLEGRYGDFIVRQTGREELRRTGEIVDQKGRALGRHRGFIFYTVGQRRGLGLGNGPWYVHSIDPVRNRIYVGRRRDILRKSIEVSDMNWLVDQPKAPFSCTVKLRYQSGELVCTVKPLACERVKVLLKKGAVVTPGQSAVFYDADRVLGGGIIL
jgi:tRNA-specific 2-thiouridylase